MIYDSALNISKLHPASQAKAQAREYRDPAYRCQDEDESAAKEHKGTKM